MVKYVVRLNPEEREQLLTLTTTGRAAAVKLLHARILLKADVGTDGRRWTDAELAEALDPSAATVHRVRQAFVEAGMAPALSRKRPTGRRYRKLDGGQEAQLVAVACRTPPEGRVRWTLKLLADKLVALEVVDTIRAECVRTTLEKNDLNPWQQQHWVIPPQAKAAFVCAMEAILEVSTRPYAPQRPQVCIDASSKQLVAATREPLPAAPGQPERVDYEYERQGTAHLCMVFEPLAGQRRVKVTERRTAVDFAQLIRALVDAQYPQAETLVLVMDNLNTHKPASLYEAFAPAEARRLMERLERHYTPKQGSWLNMAETACSVLATQCLDRRLAAPISLCQEVAAWEQRRNQAQCTVDWRFTTPDARIKLKRLYPSIQLG